MRALNDDFFNIDEMEAFVDEVERDDADRYRDEVCLHVSWCRAQGVRVCCLCAQQVDGDSDGEGGGHEMDEADDDETTDEGVCL
jgi:hypothetical protein